MAQTNSTDERREGYVPGATEPVLVTEAEVPPAQPQPRGANACAIVGIICAIAAICLCWVPWLNWILWIVGAALSLIALYRPPRQIAVAGVIISIAGAIVLCILMLLGIF